MEWYHIEVTRNCAFDYVGYNRLRRVLRIRVAGGAVTEYGGVPWELARSFPTGITALSFVLSYVDGRYPKCAAMNPEEDPEFPKAYQLPSGETVEINPQARKAISRQKRGSGDKPKAE